MFLYRLIILSQTKIISTVQFKNRASSSYNGVKANKKVVAPIYGEITLTEESINIQQVPKGPIFITQLESPEPDVIVVDKL